jgi:hypothetical protein
MTQELIEQTEALLEKWKHPDPYRPPTAPGGSKFQRNLPSPRRDRKCTVLLRKHLLLTTFSTTANACIRENGEYGVSRTVYMDTIVPMKDDDTSPIVSFLLRVLYSTREPQSRDLHS